jgi:hypothetical protein
VRTRKKEEAGAGAAAASQKSAGPSNTGEHSIRGRNTKLPPPTVDHADFWKKEGKVFLLSEDEVRAPRADELDRKFMEGFSL